MSRSESQVGLWNVSFLKTCHSAGRRALSLTQGLQLRQSLKLCFFSLSELINVILPAGFKTFEFLDKEGLQNLGTLVEGRVAGVVVAAVVEDFGHVCYKLGQLDVLPLL